MGVRATFGYAFLLSIFLTLAGVVQNPAVGAAPPQADAGFDRTVAFDGVNPVTVVLDGTASADADGDKLTFSWSIISAPVGSGALLDNSAQIKPSFILDVAGNYVVQLVANDGTSNSAPDTVTISTSNSVPVARAGRDRLVTLGETVELDGSASWDVDGDSLSFAWTLVSAPAGSAAAFSDPTAVRPSFGPVSDGEYVIELVVGDGAGTSETATIRLNTGNIAPVSDAGEDLLTATTVIPDGYRSHDANGDSLTYSWSVLWGSAGLSDATQRRPTMSCTGAGAVCVAQLIVNDGALPGVPETMVILAGGTNVPPVADAGPDQSVAAGATVQLDATGSYDVNYGSIGYRWALTVKPAGSLAAISDPLAARPTFTADLPGTYVAQLIASDGAEDSRPDTVVVGTGNLSPVANAGVDQLDTSRGPTILLNGSGSWDPNGDVLTYRWALTERPTRSTTTLSDPTAANPTFVADQTGVYMAQLYVSDGQAESLADTVIITNESRISAYNNVRPVAAAGLDQLNVAPGSLVQLDGTGTTNLDGGILDYRWELTVKPEGSTATLSSLYAASPTFVADQGGIYVAQLVAKDVFLYSEMDTVVVKTANTPPVANAGPDQAAALGATVVLDGTGSIDVDGDPLTYVWSVDGKPLGSTITLDNVFSATPSFVPDLEGDYTFSLVVSDGEYTSAADSVIVTASNQPPVLGAIGPQSVDLGSQLTVQLTATDPNPGTTLAFSASPLPLPANASLDSETGLFTFRPDEPQVGTYNLTFSVSDGLLTDSESVSITVNGAPVGGVTAITGRVLDTNDYVVGVTTPVVGATISIIDAPTITTVTDANGYFMLSGIPAGLQTLDLDTSTAGVAPDGSPYAGFREELTIIADVTNNIDRPLYLPRIETASLTYVSDWDYTYVRNTRLGITLTVPPYSARYPDGSYYYGPLSISEVPNGLAPAALPDTQKPGLLVTIQPVGIVFDTPAKITFPNVDNLMPNQEVDLWSLDAASGAFAVVGKLRVNSTGTQLATISGGIRAADWHHASPGAAGLGDDNDGDDCAASCSAPSGSQTSLNSGDLSITHDLVGYQSAGASRSLQFVYNSTTADPRPIIRLSATMQPNTTKPLTMSLGTSLGGIGGASLITNTGGLSDISMEQIVQAMQVDATSLPSGLHDFHATVFSNYADSTMGSGFSGKIIVNNERESVYGAGWTVKGLQRIIDDGEGNPVILQSGGSVSRMSLPEYTGNGAFQPANGFGSIGDPLAFAVDDFDGDGNKDLAVPDNATGDVYVMFGDGAGGFGRFKRIDEDPWRAPATGKTVAIATGHVNQDGIKDIAVADKVGSSVAKIFGIGQNGNFREPPEYNSAASSPNTVGIADFNGDKIEEIVSAGGATCSLSVGGTCYGGLVFHSMIIADFNGDSNPDIAVTRPASSQIYVFTNNGLGQFNYAYYAAGLLSSNIGYWELGSGDFDRNGALDIAVTNRDSNTVTILWNNGAGAFPTNTAFAAGTTPVSLDVADFNSDGFDDLVVASDTSGDITLLYGDGNGGFSVPATVTIGGVLASVRVADFNNDHVADLAVGNKTSGAISVLLGLPSDTVAMNGRGGDYSVLSKNADNSFTRIFRDGRTIEFDTQGLQTALKDLAGRTVGFTYDASGRLWKITDEAGLVTTFQYGISGKLQKIIDPAQRETVFEHDLSGNLVRIVDPDNTERTFAYDMHHRMRSQKSKRGYVTEYEYNGFGRHVRAVWPDFTERLVESAQTFGLPDPDSGLGSSANPAPFTRKSAVLGTFTDGNGQTETRKVNRFGLTTSITDALGRTATIQRDPDNKPEKITLPGREITVTYYKNGLIHTRTVTDTTTHSVPYSTNGQTRTWTYTYNDQNRVETIDGPRTDVNDVLTMQYDPVTGDVTSMTNALGHTIQFTARNGFGQPLTMVDQNNVQTGFTYFPQGWLQSVTTDQLGTPASYSFTYDAAGQVKTMTTPGGATLSYEYDQMGRVKAIQNDDGERIENTYDAAGNMTATNVRAAGTPGLIVRTSGAAFDKLDRLLKTVGAYAGEETLFEYDGNGNVKRIVDPRSNATTIAYDAVDRVKSVTDALQNQSSNSYDEAGNLETVTDQRNLVTSHVYNGFGEPIQLNSPDAGSMVIEYDSAGNVTKRTDARGVVAQFTYDAAHRPLSMTFPATPAENVTYSYDDATPGHYGLGRLASLADQSGSTAYRYNSRGNITRVERVIGTQTYVSQYAWNTDGLLVEKVFPSGRIVTYTRDIQGRVTAVRTRASVGAAEVTLASAIAYEPFGPVNSLTYGNGVTVGYGYDLDGRLSAIDTFNGATPVLDLDYSYDLAGNITGIADAGGGQHGRNYGYNAVNRLDHAELLDGTGAVAETLDYVYDGVGNRTERRIDGAAETYSYDTASNRLLSVLAGGVTRSFTYNEIGDITLDNRGGSGTTLTYNSTGRLVQVSAGAVVLVDYVYGADGQRAVKATPTATTHYLYEPGGALFAETDGAGNVTREYITLGGVTLAVMDAGGTSYVHADHLGTAQTMTGAGGAVVWDANYRPFGEVAITAASASLNQRFPGQYADAETGYYDNWNRSYDPSLGRYLQADPIGLAGGMSLYGYAGGNPVMRFDPFGLREFDPVEFAWVMGATAVGVTAVVLVPAVVPVAMLAATGWQAYQVYGAAKVVWDQYNTGGWCSVDNLQLLNLAVEAFWLMTDVGILKYLDDFARGRNLAESEKRVPNPWGKKGGPAHQNKVAEVAEDIRRRGLTPEFEHRVYTPNGEKGYRDVDVVAKDANGNVVEYHQVGRQTKGGNPVARERRAQEDIQQVTNRPVDFHPYN